MSRLVDLSHAVEHGMITHPGLPGPLISTYLSFEASRANYAPGTEFQIGRIEMVANTGTYVDAPAHRFAGRADLAALPLERLADLPVSLVHAGPDRAIGPEAFDGVELAGRAVLVVTSFDRHWGTPAYLRDNPFLTEAAARRIASGSPALVGIDSLNVDDIGDPRRPAHTLLLDAGIPLVEHLCGLAALPGPPARVRFFAVPVKVRGMATFPVRAFALVEDPAEQG